MTVSVVVPTYNRAELLERTIPALANQATNGVSYDVHFVDDGSRDGSSELLEKASIRYADRIHCHFLPHSGGPSAPRNHGIRNCSGELLILLDDDIIPDSDFVLRHWEFHQRTPDNRAVAIGELYMSPDVRRDPMSLFFDFPYGELRKQRNPGYLFFWSGNISLKRCFMLQHGMFRDDGSLPLLEDMECGYRLAQQGMRLHFHPAARGLHVHKMQNSWVAAKGYSTGRAQYALTQIVPDVAVKSRFGVLSRDLPLPLLAWRLLRRAAFRCIDNPLTIAMLRAMGAKRPVRSKLSDFYYYLIFRRNMLQGYRDAERGLGHSRARQTAELQSEARAL